MQVLDVDHDGFNDLVASDSQTSAGGVVAAGQAFVLFGPTLTDSLAIAATNPVPFEQLGFGASGMSIGDANGDGEYDVLLGGPGYTGIGGTSTDLGRARLFLGPDFSTEVVFDDPSPEEKGQFGYGVLLADLDGDGLDDVVVGAPQKTNGMGHGQILQSGQVWA